MSTLRANIIDSAVNTEFKDTITANGDKQWVDSYGVIKTNRTTSCRGCDNSYGHEWIINRAYINQFG